MIQKTRQMKEAEASTTETLSDTYCMVKYLHLATPLLSSSQTYKPSCQAARHLLLCDMEHPQTFWYENYVVLSIKQCITKKYFCINA